MKKILKKVQIIFAVILLCYNAIFIPKNNVVRADGGATAVAGGMLLGSLSPAIVPVILIGLVAVVILGLAIDNWEEIQALGHSVSIELNKLGASVDDFVSGTSVTVNDTLKQAIFNAGDNMGDSLPGYVPGSYVGNGTYEVFSGTATGSVSLVKTLNRGNLWIGNIENYKETGFGFLGTSFKKDKDIAVSSLNITVNIQPITSTRDLSLNVDYYSGGRVKEQSMSVTRDDAGNVVSISGVYGGFNKLNNIGKGVFLRIDGTNKYNVTSVVIPELGVGVIAPEVPTIRMREREYDEKTREQVAEVVFGGTAETITFRPDVNISEVTALNLPTVTDKTYDAGQVRTLEELQAGASSEAGSTATAGAVANPGATTGLLDLSGLWDWLKKIWESILGIPAAILAGLQVLWQALTKILSDILKAIADLGTAIGTYILDGLKAMFGVDSAWFTARVEHLKVKFSEKFPSIKPITYSFVDKENVSDVVVDFPMFGRQTVVSGAVATEFAKVVKVFLRGLFYILLALFFFRKFHKTAEG